MGHADPEPNPAAAAPVAPPDGLGTSNALALLLSFGVLVFLVYRAGLSGPFLSDDGLYYVFDPATASPSLAHVLAILDPRSQAHLWTHNYAPLHLLMVMGERWLFGTWMPGYHLVNLLLHSVNGVLLVALLLSSGVPRIPAILGGVLFLLHPAQVEAVEWISELKSVACATFGLGALLLLERHPRVSTGLFGLALLVKFAAVAFLPMAAVLVWVRRTPRSTAAWLAGWLVLLAAVAAAELTIFGYGTSHVVGVFDDRFEQLRSIAAIGTHYLWMAGTGLGLSAFQDPEPARSLLDRRWLVGLACGALLLFRLSTTLRRRDEEAAYWVLAVAAFVPVSQLVPFRYAIADRYLYFILPGLIGGSWLALIDGQRRLGAYLGGSWARLAGAGACAAVALLAACFAFQARARVPLWLDLRSLILDAARHYPHGSQALYVRAVRAAEQGDVDRAVAELRHLESRWHLSLTKDYDQDPNFARIRSEPAFREFVRETARFRIELARRRGVQPGEKVMLALKHVTLGEYDTAIELIEESIREGNPRREELLQLLAQVRALRREQGERPPEVEEPAAPH